MRYTRPALSGHKAVKIMAAKSAGWSIKPARPRGSVDEVFPACADAGGVGAATNHGVVKAQQPAGKTYDFRAPFNYTQ